MDRQVKVHILDNVQFFFFTLMKFETNYIHAHVLNHRYNQGAKLVHLPSLSHV